MPLPEWVLIYSLINDSANRQPFGLLRALPKILQSLSYVYTGPVPINGLNGKLDRIGLHFTGDRSETGPNRSKRIKKLFFAGPDLDTYRTGSRNNQ